jgi:hypothetical protein
MLTADDARAIALSLPGAIEQDHHGRPSFRVAGRIFATLWTGTTLHVMLGDELILAAVESEPACAPRYWGTRLAAVQVDLERADADLVRDLLAAAWSRRVPG